ncbi:hypothetical protein F5Y03DRAFT_183985 [Xylaria venustula]|nr:hypothetical protein F5Y03DRAFT_183985 [Xylaria venustula]
MRINGWSAFQCGWMVVILDLLLTPSLLFATEYSRGNIISVVLVIVLVGRSRHDRTGGRISRPPSFCHTAFASWAGSLILPFRSFCSGRVIVLRVSGACVIYFFFPRSIVVYLGT